MSTPVLFDLFRSNFLARHVFDTNLCFRDMGSKAKYNFLVDQKKIIPAVHIPANEFTKYDLDLLSMLRGLGWESLLNPTSVLVYPDAVFQFYANLKVENKFPHACFSTFVDGYQIFVTAEMLNLILGMPDKGRSLTSESEFKHYRFDHRCALNVMTGGSWNSQTNPNVWQLSDNYKLLHFAITRVLFPRSRYQTVISPIDVWILHNGVARNPLSFAHLMFSHMLDVGTDFGIGELLYGAQITTLLRRLGLKFDHKYIKSDSVNRLRAQHVLRAIRWRPTEWVCTSGNDADGEDGEEEIYSTNSAGLVTHGVPRMPWCTHYAASDFEADPEMPF